jgi:hypothetical protein
MDGRDGENRVVFPSEALNRHRGCGRRRGRVGRAHGGVANAVAAVLLGRPDRLSLELRSTAAAPAGVLAAAAQRADREAGVLERGAGLDRQHACPAHNEGPAGVAGSEAAHHRACALRGRGRGPC